MEPVGFLWKSFCRAGYNTYAVISSCRFQQTLVAVSWPWPSWQNVRWRKHRYIYCIYPLHAFVARSTMHVLRAEPYTCPLHVHRPQEGQGPNQKPLHISLSSSPSTYPGLFLCLYPILTLLLRALEWWILFPECHGCHGDLWKKRPPKLKFRLNQFKEGGYSVFCQKRCLKNLSKQEGTRAEGQGPPTLSLIEMR